MQVELTQPTISVVIPTYKHAQFILHTLDSVFAQTLPPLEIIVVNDGSPDNTEEILQPLIRENRIKYIAQANQGQAKARNRGIDASSGEFIALLDDDDLWPPDKLAHQMQALQNHPEAVLAYGDVSPFANQNNLPHRLLADQCSQTEANPPTGHVLRQFLRRNWIVSPGQTLLRRSAFFAVKGFDPEIWGCDDYDLYIRLAKYGQFVCTKRTALFYRQHQANASRNIERMYKNNRAVLSKNLGAAVFFATPALWIGASWYSRQYFFDRFLIEAQKYHKAGDFRQARQLLRRGVQIFPPGMLRRTYLSWVYRCVFNKHHCAAPR